MKVLISNASGTKNLGDLAICQGLIEELCRRGEKVHVHVFEDKYLAQLPVSFGQNIYHWTAFETKSAVGRLVRMVWILWLLLFPKKFAVIAPETLKSILEDYKNADEVVLIGGGYFRSRNGISQQLNAVMNGLPILIAKKLNRFVQVRPISFGPFGWDLTARVCAWMLEKADVVYVRDLPSKKLLKKYLPNKRVALMEDDAFLLQAARVKKTRPRTLGFTVREWGKLMDKKAVDKFCLLIQQKARQHACVRILPIVHVDVEEYGEGDLDITKQVADKLGLMGMMVSPVSRPDSVGEVMETLGRLTYLVGMRMHSCILAVAQEVGCTGLAYEHKHYLLEKYGVEVIGLEEFVGESFEPGLSSVDIHRKVGRKL